MNLVSLSESEVSTVETLFTQFHAHYTDFFQTQTRCVAKPAKAYLHGQLFTQQRQNLTQYCREVPDSEYEAMQHFISNSPWDEAGLRRQLQQDVCHRLADAQSGALILDESGIPKQGTHSVGVGRQYCGSLGKVDNCQVGVYLAYANPTETTLVDYRLYLPSDWMTDSHRRTQCGVPTDIAFQSKAQLGLEMILAFKAKAFPFGWVGMDAHYGEQPWLLERLNREGICYMADIPSDTRIFTHCPKTAVPTRQGKRGRHPKKKKLVAGESKPQEVRVFAQRLPITAWSLFSVRETERGWLIAHFAAVRVWHAVDNLPFQEVWLVIRKEVDTGNLRFSFSNAPATSPLFRLAQMQCRRYWVERALENAKGEAGLDQYEIRGWLGWHHHMTLTLLAMFFLLQLTLHLREKAPLLTIQDAREILERFLPRKSYSPQEFIALIEQKHQARLSARRSHAKKQAERIQSLNIEMKVRT